MHLLLLMVLSMLAVLAVFLLGRRAVVVVTPAQVREPGLPRVAGRPSGAPGLEGSRRAD
jgi:hypothetical protein